VAWSSRHRHGGLVAVHASLAFDDFHAGFRLRLVEVVDRVALPAHRRWPVMNVNRRTVRMPG